MELIVKGSKAEQYISAIIKANRDSVQLPAPVRSQLMHLAKVYEFMDVKTYPDEMMVIAKYLTETGRIILAIWKTKTDEFCNITWEISIQTKAERIKNSPKED